MTPPKFVISLTTSPKRLPHIGETINSMYRQNVKPDKIYLNIPPIFKRTSETYPDEIPEKLKNAFDNIVWNVVDEDVGPATKLHGALQLIPEDENVWIITIDDDILYLPYTIEMYARLIMALHPDIPPFAMGISSFSIVNGALKPIFDYGPTDVLEGYGSVCYHRKFFTKSWKTYLYKCIEDQNCRLSDDLFISNWLSLLNIKRIHMSIPWVNRKIMWANKCILPYGNDEDALHNGAGVESLETNNNIVRYSKAIAYLYTFKLLSKELILKLQPPTDTSDSVTAEKV